MLIKRAACRMVVLVALIGNTASWVTKVPKSLGVHNNDAVPVRRKGETNYMSKSVWLVKWTKNRTSFLKSTSPQPSQA